MFNKVFGALGNILGETFGGSIFSSIGRIIGSKIGAYIDDVNGELDQQYNKKYLDQFVLRQEIYGLSIPIIYGKARVSGRIIWTDKLSELTNSSNQMKYFNGNLLKSHTHNIEYEYYLSFAIAICEGEITDISRVWDWDAIIDLSRYQFRLYKGSDTQTPDPLIEKTLGYGLCPAFRGIAYIVFENLPLSEFNNNLPNLSFEVLNKIDIESKNEVVEDLINSIIIIPGSGEYVYDTKIQYKYILSENLQILDRDPINSHNHKKISNSIFSLDQLQFTCKSINWVSPVVSWFISSIDIKDASILPAVEFQESDSYYSEQWIVGKHNRSNSRIISKDKMGNPQYGGTVNDQSIIRYLDELKKRNLKIMFYPMLFVDLPNKPWRGRITGSSNDIYEFFHKEDGYNNFILHYAKLVQNRVDAFIIGSELIGITKIRDEDFKFPAVKELINLAKQVKEILGPDVKISYAADWSEYHHADEGWYNLDYGLQIL